MAFVCREGPVVTTSLRSGNLVTNLGGAGAGRPFVEGFSITVSGLDRFTLPDSPTVDTLTLYQPSVDETTPDIGTMHLRRTTITDGASDAMSAFMLMRLSADTIIDGTNNTYGGIAVSGGCPTLLQEFKYNDSGADFVSTGTLAKGTAQAIINAVPVGIFNRTRTDSATNTYTDSVMQLDFDDTNGIDSTPIVQKMDYFIDASDPPEPENDIREQYLSLYHMVMYLWAAVKAT